MRHVGPVYRSGGDRADELATGWPAAGNVPGIDVPRPQVSRAVRDCGGSAALGPDLTCQGAVGRSGRLGFLAYNGKCEEELCARRNETVTNHAEGRAVPSDSVG
ncbi:hypothetical protein GCM10027200_25030 [Lentzea nigeriaca]